MRSVRQYWLATLWILLYGCSAKPIALHISTEPSIQTPIEVRLTEGKEAAIPVECQTPCSVAIPSDTKHELNLKAPGYYSVTMEVSYEQVKSLEFSGDVKLVVPLQRRSPGREQRTTPASIPSSPLTSPQPKESSTPND